MHELQIFAALSLDAVSTEAPTAENTAEIMTSTWPASARRHSPAAELQIHAVLSFDAVSAKAPSAPRRRRLRTPQRQWHPSARQA